MDAPALDVRFANRGLNGSLGLSSGSGVRLNTRFAKAARDRLIGTQSTHPLPGCLIVMRPLDTLAVAYGFTESKYSKNTVASFSPYVCQCLAEG